MSIGIEDLAKGKKKKRQRTVYATQEVYDLIGSIAAETGHSRPVVLESLVFAGYNVYQQKK